ncbi:MAG: transcription-repair coupling factor, partial [Bacteroidia bacterium]|nr:transcription-repair coupling factor [Bacteroidia bacterium]
MAKVSDKKELLSLFENHPHVQNVVNRLETLSDVRMLLKGLTGSSASFIASAVYNQLNNIHLFVLNDKEEAAYFYNDIEKLLGESQVLFFPSSYKKTYKHTAMDNTNVLSRAEVLSRLTKAKQLFIVTFPEAVHEKVTTKVSLQKNTVEAKVGELLSVDFIIDFLEENEFDRVDFVNEAGQYAVRGGIVDVFSFANELPYRLEFDDEEIASIRSFDPISQLSEKDMGHITIIPNVQSGAAANIKESIFDYLPESASVWIKDINNLVDHINSSLINLPADEKKDEDEHELFTKAKAQEVYIPADELVKQVIQFSVIEFRSRSFFNDPFVLQFETKPQPPIKKNFLLLLDKLKEFKKKRFENIILCDSARQIERLYSIFEDLTAEEKSVDRTVPFTPLQLSVHEGFVDSTLNLAIFTDHQIFNRYHRFRLRKSYTKDQAITLKELASLKPGDFITHIDHGVGKFAGLQTIDVKGKPQEAIRLVYRDNDILYISIHALHRIAKFSGKDGTQPTLNKLGSNAWSTLKNKTKKKVKDIAKDLIALYAKRRAQKGFAFDPDTYLQNELEASFMYEDTPDQNKATVDVKKDMEIESPMDRLICGDVGFGKTEIAVRAAFKAVTDSKQVAVLVPTTILAFQHYRTFTERLRDFPCKVDYINRFKTTAQQKETLKKLAEGKIDILIGTHRLLSKDIKFKDLGLFVVDEEQKFGVAAKEKLKNIKLNVDTLTLTATPIPRTLQFSLMGARDLSIINTPPPNRYPVTTELHVFNEKIISEAINYELDRGGQVFFVHNRVANIHEVSDMIQRMCPDAKIGIGHGQMEGDKLENVLLNFIEGDTDVLVATTIIESGLDISNANTIIINQAQNFGLSDLHQIRGRVGRSSRKAFCYLITPPISVLTSEARQRLRAIEEHSDLGSGFNVAMRDLDIRGAGNLLGGEQSGFISEIGFEMYHKILDEAIQELKESEFKDLFKDKMHQQFVSDCQIDTDLEILIPDYYVSSITERLNLYKQADSLENEDELLQ